MSGMSNALLAGVFAASMIVAPAAFAQTAPEPTGKAKIQEDTSARQPENAGTGSLGATMPSSRSASTGAPEPTRKAKLGEDTSARQPENNQAGSGGPSSNSTSTAGRPLGPINTQ